MKKNNIYNYIKKFTSQGKESSDLRTKDYLKEFRGCRVQTSFGLGKPAKVPWMAFLKKNNEVRRGIYPCLLLFKDIDLIILSYGVSEANSPNKKWIFTTHQKQVLDYLLTNYNYKPHKYGKSFVYKAYDVNNFNKDTIIDDLNSIINNYLALFE